MTLQCTRRVLWHSPSIMPGPCNARLSIIAFRAFAWDSSSISVPSSGSFLSFSWIQIRVLSSFEVLCTSLGARVYWWPLTHTRRALKLAYLIEWHRKEACIYKSIPLVTFNHGVIWFRESVLVLTPSRLRALNRPGTRLWVGSGFKDYPNL